MSRELFGYGCAFVLTLAASTAAQQQASPAGAQANAVTIEGCLVREVDVPSRRPPETDRARIKADDEYILTNTKMIKGSAPSTDQATKRDDTPTGTAGTASPALLYKVEDIEKDQLAEHRGKRVQIDGVFAHLDRANNQPSPATDLVEIRSTAIRPVPGDCPSK